MTKRIIGAIIGMVLAFVIFKFLLSYIALAEVAAQITIALLLGGLLVAYIADRFNPKTWEKIFPFFK